MFWGLKYYVILIFEYTFKTQFYYYNDLLLTLIYYKIHILK